MKNIEKKFYTRNNHLFIPKIEVMEGAYFVKVLTQTDVFYPSPHGRLKLRYEWNKDARRNEGTLVAYQRSNDIAARASEYYLYKTDSPIGLDLVLSKSLGLLGRLDKTRTLYMYKSTRIHVDSIVNLGDFIEFETVMNDEMTDEEAYAELNYVVDYLGLKDEDAIATSYFELLTKK